MKKFKFGGKKGITIVSVVITVVLLILLAAIAMNVLSGEDNIIEAAKESKYTQDVARITEKLELLKGPIMIDKNKVDIKTYLSELTKRQEDYKVDKIEWDETTNYAYVTVEGEYQFLIEDRLDGNVIITPNGVASNLKLSSYQGEVIHPNTITFEVIENESNGKLTVSSSNEKVAKASLAGTTVTVVSQGSGVTDIIVKSEAKDKYGEARAKYQVTVRDGELGVLAEDYRGVYDGEKHSIKVSTGVEGTKVTYSTSENGTYTENCPEYIVAGNYTTYYKVEKEGYNTVKGSATVEILKAQGEVKLSEYKGTITYPNVGTFRVTENLSQGTLEVTSSNDSIAKATISGSTVTVKPGLESGKAIITVKSLATQNYNEAQTTYEMTVENGTLDVTAKGYTGTYDGNDHGIEVTCTTTGATITYSDKEDGTYTGVNPTYRNVGTYTVYYKVEKQGYSTVTGNKTIEITKADGKVTLSETSGSAVYGEEKTFKVTENLSQGTLSVKSSNENIAKVTISGTTVAIEPGLEVGKATVTVTSSETQNYKEAQATYEIDVKANENTPYKVIHQKMKLDETYETVETEEKTGVALTKVTPDVKTYEGFKTPAKQEVTIAVDGSTTIIYKYERNKYLFTLGSASGINTDGSSTSGNYYYGQQITLKATANEGYTWSKWLSNNTSLVSNKDAANTTFTMPAGPITMTPSTEVITYTISYNLDGGTVEEANPTSYKITSENITLNNPTKAGYTFKGWTGSNGEAIQTSVTIAKGSTGNKTYTANWEEVTYTITYNLNGGSVTTANPTSYNVNTADITLNNPSKEGYTFTGWTGSNGTTAQTSVTILKGSTGNKTYTANYSENTYTIAFNANGGSGSMASISNVKYTANTTLTANTFTRAGYTFAGWNTKQDGTGINYANTASVSKLSSTAGATVTLYAKWTVVNYTISYTLNGGSVATANPTTYNVNTANITLNNPTRNGYTFKGWTGSNGEAPQTSVTIAKGSTGNKTYTANWEEVTYTISYNLNGGTVANANPTSYKITSEDITLNNPSKTGYTFTGWTGSNGNTAQTSVKIAKGSTGNKTYTANFAENSYTIAFNANGGTGSMSSMTGVKYTETKTLTANTFTRAGYTFAGWNTKQDGTGTNYADSASVSKLSSTAGATITLYAKWNVVNYTISYDLAGGSVATANPTSYNVNTAAITLNNPTKTGYTFAGWTGSNGTTAQTEVTIAKGSSGNKSYTANWTVNQYYLDLNFTVDGTVYGTGYDGRIKAGLKVGGVDKGYCADHYSQYDYGTAWQIYGVQLDGVNVSYTMSGTVGAATTAAKPEFYTLNIAANNTSYGTVSQASVIVPNNSTSYTTSSNVLTLSDGRKVTASPTSLAGYTTTFSSWSPASGKITAKTNVTANFARTENTYTIAFNANGGSGTMTSISNVKYTASTTLTANAFTRNGYTFAGWNTKADGTGTNYANSASVSKLTTTNGATVTLYAKWNVVNYTISYTLNGGSVATANPTSYNVNTAAITLNNPTKTGYTFKGWTGSNGNTAQTSVTIAKGSTGNKTYTANWEEVTYTISYNLNGGSVATANPTSYKITTADITLNNPTKEGYTFTGWTGSNGNTAQTSVKIAKGSTGNKSYTANYSEHTYTIAFNANGGSGSMTSMTGVKYSTATTLTANTFTRAGYTFAGWNTKQDGTGTNYANSASVSKLTTTNGATVTLYAKWTANTYTLTVNPNGGTYNGTTSNTTINGLYDSRKNVGTPSAAPAGYTVTFDGNGATAPSSQTSTKTFSSWTKSGTGEYVAASNPTINKGFVRTVKTESGETYENFTYTASSPTADTWYSLRYPGYTYTAGNTYEIRFKLRINSISNSTLEFRHSAIANDYGTTGRVSKSLASTTSGWQEVVLTRTISGTTITQSNTSYNIAPVFEIYTNNLLDKAASGSFDVKDLMIINKTTGKILQSNSNLFWYRAGNGTLTANYTNNSITLPSISRSGYTFNGWYTQASGGTRVGGANETYTPTAATKLYAQWTAIPTGTITISNVEYDSNSKARVKISTTASGYTLQYATSTSGPWTTITSGSYTGYSFAVGTTVYARLCSGTNEANEEYPRLTIPKRVGSVTLSASSGTITYPNTGSFTVTGNTSNGTLSVVSSDTSIATASISGTTVTITPKALNADNQKATITVTSAATTNYNAASATYEVTVNRGQITLEYEIYKGVYDGKAHPVVSNVKVTPSDVSVLYIKDKGEFSSTIPTVTDAGTFSVTINAGKAGYVTKLITDSTGKVDPMPDTAGNLTLSATSGTITYPSTGSFTVTKNTSGGTLSVSSSNTNVATASISGSAVTVTPKTTAGTATITVTSAAKGNYAAQTAKYTATVKNGTITLSATPYSGMEDGTAHNAITSVSVTPSDATITYSLNGGSYTSTVPTVTNAGTYTVKVRATKAGYTTKEIQVSVVVDEKPSIKYIWNNGPTDEYTGGWTNLTTSSDGTKLTASASSQTQDKASTKTCYSTEGIDLTGYNYCTINSTSSTSNHVGTAYANVGFDKDYVRFYTVSSGATNTTRTYTKTIDISALEGEHQLYFYLYGKSTSSYTGYVSKASLGITEIYLHN